MQMSFNIIYSENIKTGSYKETLAYWTTNLGGIMIPLLHWPKWCWNWHEPYLVPNLISTPIPLTYVLLPFALLYLSPSFLWFTHAQTEQWGGGGQRGVVEDRGGVQLRKAQMDKNAMGLLLHKRGPNVPYSISSGLHQRKKVERVCKVKRWARWGVKLAASNPL